MALIGIFIFISAISNFAQASTLDCSAGDIRIAGAIQTQYLRMGHSTFWGNLTAYVYKNRVLIDAIDIQVMYGDIQDNSYISSNNAKFNNYDSGILNLVQENPSFIQFGGQNFNFTPHCEIFYSE
jgi:hypothetical protein